MRKGFQTNPLHFFISMKLKKLYNKDKECEENGNIKYEFLI